MSAKADQLAAPSTSTRGGLTVQSRLDERVYATKRTVSDNEMAAINMVKVAERSAWNYTIYPSDITPPNPPTETANPIE